MDRKEYFVKWAAKTKESVDDLEADFQERLKQLKEQMPEKSEQELEFAALMAMKRSRSRAAQLVEVEATIIGESQPWDMIASARKEAEKKFEENPDLAIKEGYVDTDGRPLWREDTFSKVPKGRIGKPLPEHQYIKRIYGIEGGNLIMITSTGTRLSDLLKLRFPARFKMSLLEGTVTDGIQQYSLSKFSKFEDGGSVENPIVKLKKLESFYCSLEDLRAYYDARKEQFERVVITEGWIVNLGEVQTGTRMVIDSLETDLETFGITCWVPESIPVNCAEGSKVVVFGRLREGKPRSEGEEAPVVIDVYGLYPDPSFTIPATNAEELEV